MSENRSLACPVCGATLSSRAFPPPEDRVITADPLSIDRSGSASFFWLDLVINISLCSSSAALVGYIIRKFILLVLRL